MFLKKKLWRAKEKRSCSHFTWLFLLMSKPIPKKKINIGNQKNVFIYLNVLICDIVASRSFSVLSLHDYAISTHFNMHAHSFNSVLQSKNKQWNRHRTEWRVVVGTLSSAFNFNAFRSTKGNFIGVSVCLYVNVTQRRHEA